MMIVSSNHLVLVAVDRYRILFEGVRYLQRRSVWRALQPVWFIWLLAICFISPFYFDWKGISLYQQIGSGWTCGTKKTGAMVVHTTLATSFGPFLALVFIYTKVFKELKRRGRSRLSGQSSPETVLEEVKSENDHNMVITES